MGVQVSHIAVIVCHVVQLSAILHQQRRSQAAGRAFDSGRAAAATTTCVELVKHNRQMLQLSLFLPQVSDLTRCCGVWMLRAQPRVSIERVYSSQRCNVLQISSLFSQKHFRLIFPPSTRRCSWLIKSVINGFVKRKRFGISRAHQSLLHFPFYSAATPLKVKSFKIDGKIYRTETCQN